jgi:hypothetical protein
MSTETPPSGNQPVEPIEPPKKNRRYWFMGAVLILFVVSAIFIFNRSKDKIVPEPEKKQEPAFHRDEPTEKQIFQDDYKTKVREMLDSGISVTEISKETKIRIDEVRKIKKEYKLDKAVK